MSARCEMSPLVEARRDQRLGALEAASVARHLEGCAVCRALDADLGRLSALSRGPALAPVSELERRRGRLRLIKAAARPRPERRVRPWAGLVAAAVLVGGGAAAARVAQPSTRPIVARAAELGKERPVVVAAPGARVAARGGVIELEDGVVAVSSRGPTTVRIGTSSLRAEGALVLEAEAGVLRSVRVSSGEASRRDAPSFALRAGDEWHAPDDEVAAAAPVEARGVLAAATPEPTGASASPRAPSPPETGDATTGATSLASPPPPPAPTTSPSSAPIAAPSPSPPGSSGVKPSEFTEAVRLVELGAYEAAERRLDAFRREHPNDARSEDAAFLRIVALQRAGRRDEARAAARRYLADYPKGFRRAEAEALAR